MNIEFYFDPICPFCWITSRWLLMVQPERDIKITWQPFSLALKNNQLDNQGSKEAEGHNKSHRVLRVILAAQPKGASLIDLYTSFGEAFHNQKQTYDDNLITQVLAQYNLSSNLLQAADDTNYDSELQNSINSAVDVAGSDIGVPTIVFETPTGKVGYFGPVLQTLPNLKESLQIWDGLSQLASTSSFYELKRGRPNHGPDVESTANFKA